jgi:cell division protein FtsZ
MHDCVDSLFIINNEKLHGDCKNIILREAFKNTDHILLNVANRMTETITLECINSIDFPDIKKVFIKGGISVMGIAVADDATGIICAVNEALDFPLFNIKPKNAKDILIHLISGTEEASMNEITDMVEYVQYCYPPSDLIWIIGKDISIGKKFSITVIATGLEF